MLRRAVDASPGCDGLILGGHGLFTWGQTQHDCYLNSIRTIDQMGEFIRSTSSARLRRFGGPT
jgi:rhamnose utilization protein RhaD (predicted bifunctional aldolase and dehydrogenase)